LRSIAPTAQRWEPKMLTILSTYIPADTALSVYGQGPGWLYAALAIHAGNREFYQFDPRLRLVEEIPGWVKPPSLRISHDKDERVQIQIDEHNTFTKLAISIDKKHLDYLQADGLPFPSLPMQHGLVLEGAMPTWLLTALVRLYASQGVAWIACYQPQLNGSVVVYTETGQPTLGTII
jgi:CRISPR-associated protein Csx3